MFLNKGLKGIDYFKIIDCNVRCSNFYNSSNYSRGKLPTQTELNKYNKVKHSNYSMQQIKTRLWKLFNYQKTRNPDYYVKPRRVELLPEIKKLWKSGK